MKICQTWVVDCVPEPEFQVVVRRRGVPYSHTDYSQILRKAGVRSHEERCLIYAQNKPVLVQFLPLSAANVMLLSLLCFNWLACSAGPLAWLIGCIETRTCFDPEELGMEGPWLTVLEQGRSYYFWWLKCYNQIYKYTTQSTDCVNLLVLKVVSLFALMYLCMGKNN